MDNVKRNAAIPQYKEGQSMKVYEIMETVPYTCKATDTIGDVIRQLADVQVRGMPITGNKGELLGYIFDSDILRYLSSHRPRAFDWGDTIIVDEDPLEEKIREMLEVPVIEVATRKRLHADPEQEIDEIATLFKKEQIKKIAVVEDGKVIGVISRSALIRHLLAKILPDEYEL